MPNIRGTRRWKARSGLRSEVLEITNARIAATRYGGAVSKRLLISENNVGHNKRTYVWTLDMPKVATTVGMN